MGGHRAAVAYCLRAEARRSWRTWLALGLLIGLAAGVVLAAAAGARRTATAYDDLLVETAAIDGAVLPACGPEAERCPTPAELGEDLRGRSGVAGVGLLASILTPVTGEDGLWQTNGDACNTGTGEVSAMVPVDDAAGRDVFRLRILEGRDVDPGRSDEVVVAPQAAAAHDVELGDTLQLQLGPEVFCDDESTWGEPTEVTVVGIGFSGLEVPPKTGFYIQGLHLSPALADLVSAQANTFVGVRLEPGTTFEDLQEEVGPPGFRVAFDREGDLRGDDIAAGLRADANALWLVAGIGAVAACFVIGPTLARFRWNAATVDTALGAMGWSRRDRMLRSVGHSVVISTTAAIVAVGVVLAASTRTPIGDARTIEPNPGPELDVLVVAAGAVLLAAVVTAGMAALAWRVRPERARERRTPLAGAASRMGLPVRVVLGIRIGLEPGPRQAPMRSSLLAVALGIAGVVGVLVYTNGAQHLRETPAWRGVPWDDTVFVNEVEDGLGLADRVAEWPEVESSGHVLFFLPPLALGEHHEEGRPMAFSTGPDAAVPTVIEGRAPIAPDEALLNPRLAADLGVEIGDRIEATFDLTEVVGPEAGSSAPFTLEIVGTGLVPIGDGRFTIGMAITREGYLAQATNFPTEDEEQQEANDARLASGIDFLLIDRREGVTDRQITERFAAQGVPYDPDPVFSAAFLDNLVSTDATSTESAPDLLAGLMALMGAGVLAYGLSTAVVRNGHDLAVIRALGVTPRRLRSMAHWAGIAFVAVALAVAVPVGIVVGRVTWRRYAEGLGVVPDPVVPVDEVVALVVVTVFFAGIVGGLAARWQSRTRPGEALRSE